MIIIGILLLLTGVIGILCSLFAFGDIAIACAIGGAAAFFSGIGFLMIARRLKRLEKREN